MEKATPYSNLKVFAHAKVLGKIAEGEQVAPIYIRIKPTNHCNHKCYYCCYADSSLGLFDSVNKLYPLSRTNFLTPWTGSHISCP